MKLSINHLHPVGRSITSLAVVAAAIATAGFSAATAEAATTTCDQIAWTGGTAGAPGQIITAGADGANRTVVAADGHNDSPQWLPGGTRLAWHRVVTGTEIVVADPDGANQVAIPIDSGSDSQPQWSPDGSKIAWTNDGLFVASSNGANPTNIAAAGDETAPFANSNEAWSPDGSRIAWVGFLPAVPPQVVPSFHIFVADANGANRSAIFEGNRSPGWSPDGSRIVSTDGHQIWVSDADGTNRVKISAVDGTGSTANDRPEWSPDGSRIVWTGRSADTGMQQIYVADTDGENRIEVSTVGSATPPTSNTLPQWSPDGSRIVWGGYDESLSSTQIFVAAADGSNRVRVSAVGGGPVLTSSSGPRWSPVLGCGDNPTPTPGPGGFTDISADAFYAEAVAWLKAENITTGTSATTYSPDGTVTRGQMAAFLHRLVGEPAGSPAHGFADVAPSAFYNNAVAWLKAENITTGTSATTYSPDDPVTRGQMAAFLHRLALVPAGSATHGFVDVAAGAFYNDAVAWLKAENITTGTSATTYSPDNIVTRGQMAAFLHRLATNSTWTRPT